MNALEEIWVYKTKILFKKNLHLKKHLGLPTHAHLILFSRQFVSVKLILSLRWWCCVKYIALSYKKTIHKSKCCLCMRKEKEKEELQKKRVKFYILMTSSHIILSLVRFISHMRNYEWAKINRKRKMMLMATMRWE